VNTYCYGINIENNTFTGQDRDAIEIEAVTSTGTTSYIKNNVISTVGNGTEDNVNGLRIGTCVGLVIEENTISSVSSNSGDGNGIIIDKSVFGGSTTDSDGVIVRYNKVTGCTTQGGAGISNYMSDNTEIYQNLSYANKIGISWGEDSGSASQSSGGLIYNNTMYGNSDIGGKIRENALGSTWRNNISWGNTTYGFALMAGGTAPTSSNNDVTDFAPDNATYDAWTDTDGITSDPLFISATNYHLTSVSPAIGAGLDLGASYSIGFGGDDQYDCRQSDAWDLGAFPYCEGGKMRYSANGMAIGYSASGGTIK
jgi:hypothetical protein